jgi:predicted transcriptional regulator
MTAQASLFDSLPTRGRTRRTDPATSHMAAQLTGKVDRDCYMHLKVTGRSFTPDELAAELHCYAPSVVTAISRLAKDGFIVRVGQGLSARGRPCGKYRAADV